MNISVIIPNLNSPIIAQVVANILNQEKIESIQEILIIGKDDNRLIPVHPLIKFIDTKHPVNAAAARNIGITAAHGELLLFLDSDCLPQEGWLAGHLAAHAAKYTVVGGGVIPSGENYWHLSYNLTLFHEYFTSNPPRDCTALPTLNLSVERQVIDTVGLMNETLARGQDIEWTVRMQQAGFQPYFYPDAAVYHQHNRTTLSRFWYDCVRSGFHMRRIRLAYQEQLQAPWIFRYPHVVMLLSPLIAAWVSLKILWQRPIILKKYPLTIPAIYLSKIAWCWGASRKSSPKI